jgi:hypothetical protein
MAYDFNGSNQWLQRSEAIFTGTSDSYTFTLAAWCRPDNRHIGSIIGADQGSGNAGRFALFSQTNRFALRRKSSYIQEPTTSYDNGNTTWFHVAGTLQKSFRELYVDGVSRKTQSTNVTIDPAKATNFYIGRDHSGKYWNGKIGECAAYNAILSANEIAQLAEGVSPLFIQPENLIGYWPLGGLYTDEVNDILGSYNLTANNSPTTFDHPKAIYPSQVQKVVKPLAVAPPSPQQLHDYALRPQQADYSLSVQAAGYTHLKHHTDYKVPRNDS